MSKLSYFPAHVEGISASTSANIVANEEAGKELGLEDLNLITCEFTKGNILSASVGRWILTLICDTSTDIGLIKLVLKRSEDELRDLFKENHNNFDYRKYLDLDKDWEDKDFAII